MTRTYLILLRGINVGGKNAISTPLYKSMTIRSWSTTRALLDRMDELAAAPADTEEKHA